MSENPPPTARERPLRSVVSTIATTLCILLLTVGVATAQVVEEWTRIWHGGTVEDDGASSVVVSPDGGSVFLAGFTGVSTQGRTDEDGLLLVYSSEGELLFTLTHDVDGGADVASDVAVSPDEENVYLAGDAWVTGQTNDIWVAKISEAGPV